MFTSKNKYGMLTGFFMCGVPKEGRYVGEEYYTDCIFCSRQSKFYVHIKKGVWQCKVCGEQGNYLKFLETVSKYNEQYLTESHLEELAVDRKLPRWALEGYNIGFDGIQYTYPYYDYEGKFCGLRLHRLGKKPMGVANAPLSLFFAQELSERKDEPVYLVEGESDCFALRYLLKHLSKTGVVVAVPGVNSFKDEWIDYFYHRDVVCFFDNDAAGMEGEMRVHEKISTVTTSIQYLHWPLNHQKFPDKYDVRDYITDLAIAKGKPKTCYKNIFSWLEAVPRKALMVSEKDETGKLVIRDSQFTDSQPATFQEIVAAFKDYLYIRTTTPIKLMLATIFANRLRDEKVWMFFVAPPSNTKTEFVSALAMCHETRHITTLTDKTLVSGWIGVGKSDPSLIPQLNNKVLVIKDFTPILTMPPIMREVIYSQLRDVYDGSFEKVFGHNIVRSYKNIHFGILAAVTGSIERTAYMQQTLGERFIRYSLPLDKEDLSENAEKRIMKKSYKAFENVGNVQDKRYKVQILLRNFLQYHKPPPVRVPDVLKDKIIYLGRLTAAMRGVVDRDFKERMIYKPTKEGPTRILKQFKLVCIGLASVDAREEVNDDDYAILKEVALSSTPSRIESIVHTLHQANGPLKGRELIEKTKFDYNSIIPILRDLVLLELIIETKISGHMFYELSNLAKFYIKKSEVYSSKPNDLSHKYPLGSK
jgi:ribosomal protein L37AE/L43A